QANVYVKLAPHEERVVSFSRLFRAVLNGSPSDAFKGNISQQTIMTDIRGRVRKYRDLRIGIRNVQTINLGSGSAADIFFNFRGPDLDKLYGYADALRQHAADYGLVDADVNIRLDKPEFQVKVDRERAADLGVDVDRVASALRLMVGGVQQVSLYHDPAINFDYDVDLRLSEAQRKDPDTISRLYIRGDSGSLVRLDNLVKISNARIASQIGRLDRQRQVAFRANVPPQYGLADRIQVLRDAVLKMNLPPEYNVVITGQGRELEKTFGEFIF